MRVNKKRYEIAKPQFLISYRAVQCYFTASHVNVRLAYRGICPPFEVRMRDKIRLRDEP